MKFVAFPSINQFRNVIRDVTHKARFDGLDADGSARYNNNPLPSLEFIATVKLHGTNAGVVLDCNGEMGFQSRNNMLELTADNAGFCAYGLKHRQAFRDMLIGFQNYDSNIEQVIAYGEWCGGSIQKGIALNELDKMFVIFAVRTIMKDETSKWVPSRYWAHLRNEEARVFTVHQFPMWSVTIDFNSPELAQNELIRITEKVENECPVGASFGVSGIGEGIVLTHSSDLGYFIFKSKGEKHSASKVKKLNSIDVEKVENIKEFVSNVVTPSRLSQGLDYLREQQLEPIDKNVGQFIKWVNGDVFKEESDTIVQNELDAKMVSREVSNVARAWYFNYMEYA